MKEIYFAGGCFWGVEKFFQSLTIGRVTTQVGYANGITPNPTYEEVCSQETNHVETVKVVYDDREISLSFLLYLFYEIIDPFAVNRQGNDRGTQYRSGVYYTQSEDEAVIKKSLAAFEKRLGKKTAIECMPLDRFYKAEEYHQNYLLKNPMGYCHIQPSLYKKAREVLVDPTLYQKKEREALKNILTPLAYEVTQNSATEQPFQNPYWNHEQKGIYVDITTGEPLFLSADKYDAGCGWPSFTKPIDPLVVNEFMDASLPRIRTEVKSRIGEAHLGHVFEDGPKDQGGLRYCINSAALRFIPAEKMEEEGYGAYIKLLAQE